MKSFYTSWRTTTGGLMLAVGGVLVAEAGSLPGWAKIIGLVLVAAGPVLMGVAARDSVVTSRKAGAE